MKLFWRKTFPILFLLGLAILFFLPYLINSKIPYGGDFTGSDLTELNLPLRFLTAESFRNGQVPLWTNLLANGFPLLAEGQAGIFYPLNFLFIILPFSLAFNFSLILNFFLASLFIYLYCRILKISQFGSILAAVAFSFSGFFIFRIKHLNLINAAVWLPLEIYLVERYFRSKKKALVLVALSLIFAIQFFAGHPQIFYLSLVSAFLYYFFKIFLFHQESIKKPIVKIVLPWVLIGIIIFGLSAISLLPTFFNSASSSRSLSMSYIDVASIPYSPVSLLFFISPYILGNPALNTFPPQLNIFGIFWENNFYFGLLPLLFSLLAIIFLFPKNKNVVLLTILLFFAFLIGFGSLSPIFIIFWRFLPGFSMFRFHQRFLFLGLICLTVLAGFGFDFIWHKLKAWQQKYGRLARSKLLVKVLLPALFILIVAVDLFIVAFNYLGHLDYDKYFSPPESAKFLKQDPDTFRIHSVNWPSSWHLIKNVSDGWHNNLSLFMAGRELIPPNLNVFWDIASNQDRASIEGGMLAKEVYNLDHRLKSESWILKNNENKIRVSDQALKVFGLENVKYLLSFSELDNNNLTLVKEIKDSFLPSLKIYQNQYFLPLAFGRFKVKTATSTEAMLEMIFDRDFDPSKQIVLAADQPELLEPETEPQAAVKVIDYQSGRLSIEADFSDDGYLFLSQSFIPGWQAKIDGKRTEILPANYAFSAVEVLKGKHQIEFLFRPVPYLIGKWLTIITTFCLLLFIGYYLFKNKKEGLANKM
jgi:hypothetical protein